MQAACLFVWKYWKCMEILKSMSFLRLKMGNLSDLVDFALTVTTRYEETRVESSLACFVWKPAHCEVLSYGSA